MFNRHFAVRGGGGGGIALPNGLWQFFSVYEPLLRNQICIIFHHYLPWFTSEYHLRIMFDHSYCQNIHSRSHNRCFKEFANFRRKIPAKKRPFASGGKEYHKKLWFPNNFFLWDPAYHCVWTVLMYFFLCVIDIHMGSYIHTYDHKISFRQKNLI